MFKTKYFCSLPLGLFAMHFFNYYSLLLFQDNLLIGTDSSLIRKFPVLKAARIFNEVSSNMLQFFSARISAVVNPSS